MLESSSNKKLEILSPAGDKECAIAAFENGADAIYLGLPFLNARSRATNLNFSELGEIVKIAGEKKKKVFVTLNTLLTTNEIKIALLAAEKLQKLKVDAIIVADIGLFWLLKREFHNLELHASTQMTTHNLWGVDFLHKLGASQINYLRELSLAELEPLMKRAHNLGIKNEIFVHGAYCISNSGICYMSAQLYGKEGNRGLCLQPCRRDYSVENSEFAPIMNLKDNCAYSQLEMLSKASADVIKIEGRIKDSSYVANVTKAYSQKDQTLLSRVFNREYSSGYLEKKANEDMFQKSTSDKSELYIGKIESLHFDAKKIIVALQNKNNAELIASGKIVKIYASSEIEKIKKEDFICSFKINSVAISSPSKELATFNENANSKIESKKNNYNATSQFCSSSSNNLNKSNLKNSNASFATLYGNFIGKIKDKIKNGNLVFLSQQEELKENSEQKDQKPQQKGEGVLKVPLTLSFCGEVEKPLTVKASIPSYLLAQNCFEAKSSTPLQEATKHSLSHNSLYSNFSKLGNTIFEIEEIECSKLAQNLFLPVSSLNEMRQNITLQIEEALRARENFPFEEVENTKTDNLKNDSVKSEIVKDESEKFEIRKVQDSNATSQTAKKTKKIAIISNSIDDSKFLESGEKLFLDTNFFDEKVKKSFSNFNENILPYFHSFLPEFHFQKVAKFIENSKKDNFAVVASSSAVAMFASSNNVPFICSPSLNISNLYSSIAIKEIASSCKGFFFSNEISKDQILQFFSEKNYLTQNNLAAATVSLDNYYQIFSPQFLMSTANCIYRNCKECLQKKRYIDDECFINCSYCQKIKNKESEEFFLHKEKNKTAEIYANKIVENFVAILELPIDNFVIDFRSLPFYSFTEEQKAKIVSFARELIAKSQTSFDLEKEKQSIKKFFKLLLPNSKFSSLIYNTGFEEVSLFKSSF